MNSAARLMELLGIFVALPLLFAVGMLPTSLVMPMLWVLALYSYLYLRRSGITVFALDFTREELFGVLRRYALVAGAMLLFMLLYDPQNLFGLSLERPMLWLVVMLLYPVLSAFAQELLFRGYFFMRYKELFGDRTMLLIFVNAALFAYMHIIFANWVAVAFSFAGGLMFAQTYRKTRSVMLVSIEHALYGNTIYTLGLGYHFYHGLTTL